MLDQQLADYANERWELWHELDDTSRLWFDIYRAYWGLDDTSPPAHLTYPQWEDARRFANIAPTMYKLALAMNYQQVVSSPSPSLDRDRLTAFRELLKAYGASPLIKDRLSFELAEDAISRLKGAEARVVRLLGVVLDHPLAERAAAYVTRATALCFGIRTRNVGDVSGSPRHRPAGKT